MQWRAFHDLPEVFRRTVNIMNPGPAINLPDEVSMVGVDDEIIDEIAVGLMMLGDALDIEDGAVAADNLVPAAELTSADEAFPGDVERMLWRCGEALCLPGTGILESDGDDGGHTADGRLQDRHGLSFAGLLIPA